MPWPFAWWQTEQVPVNSASPALTCSSLRQRAARRGGVRRLTTGVRFGRLVAEVHRVDFLAGVDRLVLRRRRP